MHISVNGKPRDIEERVTIHDLIESLDLNPRHVAIEVNQQLVSRDKHTSHELCPGDELEIVTLAGGG